MTTRRTYVVAVLALMVGGCSGRAPGTVSPTTSSSPTVSPVNPSVAPASATPSAKPRTTPAPTFSSTSTDATKAPAGSLRIVMTVANHLPRYQPDTVTAKAGTVVFFLDNVPGDIAVDHNVQIGAAVGDSRASSRDVQANEKVVFTVNDVVPGTYVFWCSIRSPDGYSHAWAGQVGTLTITP